MNAIVDTNWLLRQVNDGVGLLRDMIGLFADKYPGLLHDANYAVKARDRAGLSVAMKELISLLSALGATSSLKTAQEVLGIGSEVSWPHVDEAMLRLEAQTRRVHQFVEELCARRALRPHGHKS